MSGKTNQTTSNNGQQAGKQGQTAATATQAQQQSQQRARAGGSGGSGGGFSSQDLNKIVLEYLGKKGYHKTEQMLRAESSRTLTPAASGVNKDVKPDASSSTSSSSTLVKPSSSLPDKSKYMNENNHPTPVSNPTNQKRDFEGNAIKVFGPNDYIRAYYKLKTWVEQSLEKYRNELQRIIYPIFVYIFLKLIKIDQPLHARKFFDNFMGTFKIQHHEELNKFFSINSVDHLKENENVLSWLNNKYKITISRTSMNLLLFYLIEMNDDYGSLIISIINEHLQPDLVPSPDSVKTFNDGIITSSESGNLSSFNLQPVKLGMLPLDSVFKKEVEYELKKQDQLEHDPSKKPLVVEFNEMNKEVVSKDLAKKKDNENGNDAAQPSSGGLNSTESSGGQASSDPASVADNTKNATPTGVAVGEASIPQIEKSDYSAGGTSNNKISAQEIPDPIPLPMKTALDVKLEIQKVKESRDSIAVDKLQIPSPNVCMYTLHNTNGDMTCVSYSEDCTMMATGFQDSIIKIWSLDGRPLKSLVDDKYEDEINGSACRTLVGHSGTVYSLSFSPCNRYLLSCSEDKTARLWSMDTFTCLVSYKGHNHPVWDVKFSPLGHYFITGSHDQTARLWSCDHIYPLRIFAGHANDVECVTFHPNGCYAFTGSSDKTVRMWELLSGNCCRLFITSQTAITCIEVTNDGRWIAIGSDEGTISIWDIGSSKRLKVLRGHGRKPIYSMQFNKEDSILVSGGGDNSCRVWDLKKLTNEPNASAEEGLKNYYGDAESSLQSDIKLYGKKKIVQPSLDLVSTFYTKKTPIYKLKCTRNNLIFGAGPYLP